MASPAATVRVIHTLDQIEEIRPAWTSWRGHRDADIDVYQTLLGCRPDPVTPHILLVERNGKPDAILIGTASTTTLREKMAYLKIPIRRVRVFTFQYGGFLGNQSKDNSELVVREVSESLRRGDADVAVLSYVREDTPLYNVSLVPTSLLMRDHFPVKEPHSAMDLPQTVDAIYRGFSAKHRGEIRRDGRKFHAAFSDDIQIRRFETEDQVDRLIELAEKIASTTYQRGLGVGFSNTRQARELLSLEAKRGWLRGFGLYAGGQACAFLIGCIYNDAFLSEYFAHDPAYAEHSPGNYLLVRAMETLSQERVARIDFGIGAAFYKQRFGSDHWHESTICLYAPTWTGVRVKALRTMAVLIDSTGKAALKRLKLAERLKKRWRQRAMKEPRNASQ